MGWSSPPASGGSFTGGAIASPIQVTGGTQTTQNPVIDSTQTWNASGVSFTAWRVNVTNTSSAATSLLADWQVGGSSVASVSVAGMITTRAGSYNNLAIQMGPGSNNGIYWTGSGIFVFTGGGTGTINCSTITNNGGIQLNNNAATAKTANYTATLNDYLLPVNATAGAITITLPSAVTGQSQAGAIFVIKKVDSSANAVTVATTSSQTIDSATTYSLPSQWNSLTVMSNGANWLITAKV